MAIATRLGGMRIPVVALALVVAACSSPALSPTSSADLDPDFDLSGTWRLTIGRGEGGAELPIVDDYPITLIFTGSSFGGVSACNQYGGRFSLAGGALSVGEISGTAMGCAPAVAAAESAYLAALRRMSSLRVEGDELVLEGPNVELRFARLPEAPTAELVDTTWILESLFVDDAANAPLGEPATLELSSDGPSPDRRDAVRSAAIGSSRATASWLHPCRWTRHRANRAFNRRIHTW